MDAAWRTVCANISREPWRDTFLSRACLPFAGPSSPVGTAMTPRRPCRPRTAGRATCRPAPARPGPTRPSPRTSRFRRWPRARPSSTTPTATRRCGRSCSSTAPTAPGDNFAHVASLLTSNGYCADRIVAVEYNSLGDQPGSDCTSTAGMGTPQGCGKIDAVVDARSSPTPAVRQGGHRGPLPGHPALRRLIPRPARRARSPTTSIFPAARTS